MQHADGVFPFLTEASISLEFLELIRPDVATVFMIESFPYLPCMVFSTRAKNGVHEILSRREASGRGLGRHLLDGGVAIETGVVPCGFELVFNFLRGIAGNISEILCRIGLAIEDVQAL